MGFIKKTFEPIRFARAVRKHPGIPVKKTDPDALTPDKLKPCLHGVYIQMLRNDSIDIRSLDFDSIGEGDIDDLENVLCNSPANELFRISDVFRSLQPSAAIGQVFI